MELLKGLVAGLLFMFIIGGTAAATAEIRIKCASTTVVRLPASIVREEDGHQG
jgi:hypothetical protein